MNAAAVFRKEFPLGGKKKRCFLDRYYFITYFPGDIEIPERISLAKPSHILLKICKKCTKYLFKTNIIKKNNSGAILFLYYKINIYIHVLTTIERDDIVQ